MTLLNYVETKKNVLRSVDVCFYRHNFPWNDGAWWNCATMPLRRTRRTCEKILITPLKVESVMRMAISIEEIIVYVTFTLHARASHSLCDDLMTCCCWCCNKVSAPMVFADNDRHWNGWRCTCSTCSRCEWKIYF